ncbi:bifunctional diguanylate cyclase/phosphodiesterase [Massilia soli]|uniref:EAL domain-containing protein n=1 Tax=Massilia soli TaxID=2792854 RepID=A0ABS7SHL4_9BURK|nr:EAL domain-containing protein [Massilia soli]MBZ2205720.1 EAL domain-containing protein [Massilia soli]
MTVSHDSTATAAKARPYSLGRLAGVTALLIAVLGAATAAMLYVSYHDAVRAQQASLRNLAIAFAAQTLTVAQAVDQVTLQVGRAYRNNGALPPPLAPYFDGNGPAQQYLLGVHLYDASGQLVASAAPPGAAGARLPSAGAPARPPLLDSSESVSVTISNVDPGSGRGVINFARAISDSRGERIGTILARVDSERFEQIYMLLDMGQGGSVTLLQRDGTMLVRGPILPWAIGRSFRNTILFTDKLPVAERGGFQSVSPVDGINRLYGYDSVPGFPLVIITGMDLGDALADWYGRLWTALAFFGLISLSLALLARRVAREATRKAALIDKLAASEARAGASADYLANILNAVGTPIWVLDSARRFVMMNEAFSRFVGRPAAELNGRPEHEVLDSSNLDDRERRYRHVLDGAPGSAAVAQLRDGSGEARTVIQMSSRLVDEAGHPQVVSVLTDITERQRAEQRLAYLADFDALTGLPNQNQFRRVLENAVADAAANGRSIGIVVVSLKRLHEISDLLGQDAGERALRQVGEAFHTLSPQAVVVARIKSAEFAVVIAADRGRLSIDEFVLGLQQRLSGPMTIGGRDFYLGPVMGVSVFPDDGASADELYRRAESARNREGGSEEDTIHFFSPSTHTDLDERLAIEAQLRRALERKEFRVEYQPKVSIRDGRIVGFEALLRWSNPVLGEVSPVRFIPIAERTGLIIAIGAWVLEETCRQMGSWAAATGAPVKVAVNLSPRQFHQKDLLPSIRDCIARWGVAAGSLELEITETALVSREQEVDVLMRGIRALGVELSIDDFGTGYSSLAYLKRFPVQRLKVDRAFIRDLGQDDDSAAIVHSVISLARNLKLLVVAEGVETEEQLSMLREMQCDEFQGYLFSRPIAADRVLEMLEANKSLA